MMPGAPLGRLHAITDASRQNRFSHGELAALAADGGADTVQFREKRGWSPRALTDEARRIRAILSRHAVELIVNDHPDVALAVEDAGVHLGDSDAEARGVRDRTRSKADPAPTLGLRGLREIVAAVSKPVIAIGGIDAERVGAVLEAGAYGVAVLSAFTDARDPAREIARIRGIIGAHDARRVEHAG